MEPESSLQSVPSNCQISDCVWIEQAAFDGITEAQILLGLLYEGGLIKPFLRDFQLAKSWYLAAEVSGDVHAKFHLYRLTHNGAVVGSLCMGHTRQGLAPAAEAGHSLAQYELGQRCEYGNVDEGVCPDPTYWYRLAADSGLAVAHDALGRLALKQVPEDPRAERWSAEDFMKAAWLGHAPAEARICGFDRKELFDTARWRDAEAWCKTLARNDENPVAAWILSKIYSDGLAGEMDASRAEFWLLRAGSLGHAVAQYRIGSHYEKGTQVPRDLESAHLWYHQASEQGYLPAQIAEGRLIESGELRCYHALAEAMELYKRASPRSLVALARYVRILIHKKSDDRVPISAMPMPTWLQEDDKWIIDDWLEA